jgi:hypothetical protein
MIAIPLRDRTFEMINNVLYVFEKGLSESGLSTNYYRKEKSIGNKRLIFIDHPSNKNYSLVSFETLSDGHKEKIINRFGNPYNYIIRGPILNMVCENKEIEQFFLQYRYNTNKVLPLKRIKQYTRACAWLELLKKIEESRNKIIKDLNIKVPEFYSHLDALIQIEKTNGASETYDGNLQVYSKFPTSYRFLRPKLQEYITNGPVCVIDKMFGNQLAAKINDEISEAQLLSLLEDPRQLDDVLICMMYNTWALKNDYKKIDVSTVGNWRRKKEHVIIIGREGNGAMNEKYIRQVKGFRPTIPLALVEHDDNNLDFLFNDEKGYEFNKYVAVIITDSHCDLVLGKSYILGQSPRQEQIYHAYLDAMYYIRSLTGGWYLPFEIKCDKWAIKSLTPFYNSIGKLVPPSHGNKHRGYIEQFFRTPLWKRSQQLVSKNNWSGNNISAKYRGVNEEILRVSAKERPFIGTEAELQIERFFQLLRKMPDFKRTNMNAPSKEQQWLDAWKKLTPEQKRPITDEQFLLIFGIKHEPQGRPITITNRGVEPQIIGTKYSYDLPDYNSMMHLIGEQVNVIYDPFDMSRVLVTNYKDIRFIARTAQLQPRSLKDQYTGSRTYLNAILAEKKEQVQQVSAASTTRKKIVNADYYNAEAILQGGTLIKEIKNTAEQRMIEQFNDKHEKYLDDNININDYL